MRRLPRPLLATAAAVLLLTACGGGSDDDELPNDTAQGYAADALTMSVAATSAVDVSSDTLEEALAASAVAGSGREQVLSATQEAGTLASASVTVPCALSGSVSWTVTGDAATLANGRLDAGETYAVVYSACATPGGTVSGAASVTVTARSASLVAYTHQTSGLTLITTNGTFVHDGSVSVSRSEAALAGGGHEVTRRVTSPGVTLASSIGTLNGTRSARYTLRTLDWTVARRYDANGALTERSHQGTVSVAANSPRRPSATLDLSSQGTLTLDGAGVVASNGRFTVVTDGHAVRCTYGAGIATLELDLGNDGSVERRWVLTTTNLVGDAG